MRNLVIIIIKKGSSIILLYKDKWRCIGKFVVKGELKYFII